MKEVKDFFKFILELLLEFIVELPMVFICCVLVIVFICYGSCSSDEPKEDKVNHIVMEDAVMVGDSIEAPWPKKQDSIQVSDEEFKIPKSKFWSSKETKLPIGIVYQMDFAGSGTKKPDQSDNYVTVKSLDGSLIITRDIDVDLYLNLVKGDTIR